MRIVLVFGTILFGLYAAFEMLPTIKTLQEKEQNICRAYPEFCD